jgi:hypothetical protein
MFALTYATHSRIFFPLVLNTSSLVSKTTESAAILTSRGLSI